MVWTIICQEPTKTLWTCRRHPGFCFHFRLRTRRNDSDVVTRVNYGVAPSSNQFHSRERETTPTTCVGGTGGCFTLIIAMSSYVNPNWVYRARLWDKCYYLLLEVVPFGIHVRRGPRGPSMDRGLYTSVLCVYVGTIRIPWGWVSWCQGVS